MHGTGWRRAAAGLAVVLGAAGCGPGELRELFDAYTPHERYARVLEATGLAQTALGRDWIAAGRSVLARPVVVSSPFREESFLDSRQASAAAYRVSLRRGQRLTATVETAPDSAYQVFLDLFTAEDADAGRRLASADSLGRSLEYVARHDGDVVLRVQPELLRGGRFALTVVVGPTLAFPVHGRDTTAIRSRYGAPRDAGRRSHEGVDIFAPRGTPVLAAADGVVRSTRPNRLGGNVVWLRDDLGRSHYYAHLERHVVERGRRVWAGDTIGFVGNSGNARTTPPHLHFGIYERGSFDPYPALYRPPAEPAAFAGDPALIGGLGRVGAERVRLLGLAEARGPDLAVVPRGAPVQVEAGVGSWYRVRLPDGTAGYVAVGGIEGVDGPLGSTVVASGGGVFTAPAGAGVMLDTLVAGTEVAVLGTFGASLYVQGPTGRVGWVTPN